MKQITFSEKPFLISITVILLLAESDVGIPRTIPSSPLETISYGRSGVTGNIHVGIATSVDVTDWDHDGRKDLFVHGRHRGSGVFFLRGVGSEGGEDLFAEPIPICSVTAPMRLFDWSADGTLDLVANEGQSISLWRCTSDQDLRFAREGEVCDDYGRPIGLPHNITQVEVVTRPGSWDILAGVNDWSEYWPGGDSPWKGRKAGVGFELGYDADGKWRGGPMHGFVYLLRNLNHPSQLRFSKPVRLMCTDGKPVDVQGAAAPTVRYRDNGLWDLFCGEHLDRIVYFRNVGTLETPLFEPGRPVRTSTGVLYMPQNMIHPRIVNWNDDGVADIVAGSEDGFIYLCIGADHDHGGVPVYDEPTRLKQVDPPLSVGVAAVPNVVDWDADGDLDLISGNAGGYIEYVRNIGSRTHPQFDSPRRLNAGGESFRVQAGYGGSIQGPGEAMWGYTAPRVADWDGDGRLDIVMSDVFGRHLFLRNVGAPSSPELAAPIPLEVNSHPLKTVWRVKPAADDWNGDELLDYVCLDQQGYLTYHRRLAPATGVVLEQGVRWRYESGEEIKLDGVAGFIGRAKLAVGDWTRDGNNDILFGLHAEQTLCEPFRHAVLFLLENCGTNASPVFRNPQPFLDQSGQPLDFGTHSPAPEIIDWNGDGSTDLIIGTEDGMFSLLLREP